MGAFSDALDRLFGDPNLAQDATWRAGGGPTGSTVRVILRRADRLDAFAATRIASDSVLADVRVSEAPTLADGDELDIAGTTYRVQGPPLYGADRLWWTVELVAV